MARMKLVKVSISADPGAHEDIDTCDIYKCHPVQIWSR